MMYGSSYDPYQNTTGAARQLAQMSQQLQQDETYRLRERLREADARIARLEHQSLTNPYSTYKSHHCIGISCSTCGMGPDDPEPSVETVDHTPSWWSRIFNDPIWEIFKRPTL